MRRSKLRLGIIFALCALVFAGIGAGTALAVQPHMVNAHADLQNALGQLNAATPDKAGHRSAAINYVNEAIGQVNAGIQAGAK
jgi:hypothetical protein